MSLWFVVLMWAMTGFGLSFPSAIPFSFPMQTAGMGINSPVTDAVPVSSTPLGTWLMITIPVSRIWWLWRFSRGVQVVQSVRASVQQADVQRQFIFTALGLL